jgi:topoisomerase-4 subunit A
MITLEKWIPEKPVSVLYFNGQKDCYFIKRFIAGNQNNDQKFIPEGSKIQLELISTDWRPVVELIFSKTSKGVRDNEIKIVDELISVKGIKAIGNKLSTFKIKNINQLDPIKYLPPEKKNKRTYC